MRSSDASATGLRVFTAIPLPGELARRIEKKVHLLDPFGKSIRWVKFKTVHLTVHFFGDLDPEKLPLLKQVTESGAAAHRPFNLVLGKAGFFPVEKQARVFWWGMEPSSELFSLVRELGGRYKENRLLHEDRDFKAHVTLGRFRDPVEISKEMVLQMERVWELEGSVFRVDHLELFKSPAGPDGYESLAAFPLKG